VLDTPVIRAVPGITMRAVLTRRPPAWARDVYLPPGRWIDPWSGADCEGPATVNVEAPLERIPIFVRAGATVADALTPPT
jgi:hypothetical protein